MKPGAGSLEGSTTLIHVSSDSSRKRRENKQITNIRIKKEIIITYVTTLLRQ